jgi:hypothetical protein
MDVLEAHLLESVLAGWLLVVAIAWFCDNGPEIYTEKKTAWLERHPRKENDPEMTVELPAGSFDPDATIKLPKVEKFELQTVFVIGKFPKKKPHGRHAKEA